MRTLATGTELHSLKGHKSKVTTKKQPEHQMQLHNCSFRIVFFFLFKNAKWNILLAHVWHSEIVRAMKFNFTSITFIWYVFFKSRFLQKPSIPVNGDAYVSPTIWFNNDINLEYSKCRRKKNITERMNRRIRVGNMFHRKNRSINIIHISINVRYVA